MPIEAVCVLHGQEGYGTVFFKQEENEPCQIIGKLKGLSPGYHGLHIHQYGNRTGANCSNTGVCFNPKRVDHGAPWDCPGQRHYGDLGNIKADSCGVARIDMTDNLVTLVGPDSVIGRSLVVHSDADDLGRGQNFSSKVDGNVGARLSCGIIGLSRRTQGAGVYSRSAMC